MAIYCSNLRVVTDGDGGMVHGCDIYLIMNMICSFLLFQGWINQYSTRRYGRSVPLVQDAWSILHHTIYNCTDGAYVSDQVA